MNNCGSHSHIIDSRFFSQGYSTDECRKIFCDLRRMQRWLDVESILASCQAELDIIPKEEAQHLVQCANLELLDIKAIQQGITATGHSLIPLLNEWQRIAGEAGQYIHFGATTQDIQDTAQSLELAEVTAIIHQDLSEIILQLCNMAEEHQDLTMIGRTHGQHALPTTFGLKAASWLDESLRNYDRLQACRDNLLVSQLFGGVGTMASLSSKADELLQLFSKKLNLKAPLTTWHNSRDRIAEYISVLALISGGLSRIANEICQLARDEIGELSEPFETGKIGSSTMPHKKNPELCEQVVVLSRLIKANATSGFDTLCSEHERDYRAVRLEWVAITDASSFCCAALKLMKQILPNLSVNQDKIKENLERAAVNISTEALMFLLGSKLGKQTAHQIIYHASNNCDDSSQLLKELLRNHEVKSNFSHKELKDIINPQYHTGCSKNIIRQLITDAKTRNFKSASRHSPTPCPLQNCDICQSD